jgi:signal transduction histidine kinase
VDEGEADPQLRAQALNVINSEARRLERIVADMLSVAEIEAGSLSIRPGDVRTDALFEDLTNDYAAQAAEKTIELGFDLPPKMPVIHGDRDRLGQALHNLVGNALKYTPPGGKVTVRVEAPEQGGLIVHVIDTGIGIDPDECERIFDRFYRANDRRIAHVTGSGLGLALAREIVRLHGGDIEVESKLDQGSTFTITLPGAEQTRQQRAA